MSNRDVMAGFVRLHIIQHANAGPVFGVGIIERLSIHGYVLSPGTLYPILHGLERDGYLRSKEETAGQRRRRIYEITDSGRRLLILSKVRLWALFKEVFEHELSPDTSSHVERALQKSVARIMTSAPPRTPRRRAARGPTGRRGKAGRT